MARVKRTSYEKVVVSKSCGFSGIFRINRNFSFWVLLFFRNPFLSLSSLSPTPREARFPSRPDPDPVTRPGFSGHLRPTQTTAPVGFSSSPPSELPCGGGLRRFNPKLVTRSSEARVRNPVGFQTSGGGDEAETGRDRKCGTPSFDPRWC